MPRKPDKLKTRRAASVVPVAVAFALRHGKRAWQKHPSWETDPDDECLAVYMICGKLINVRGFGKKLWTQYRAELLKMPGVKTWWGYSEYESSKRVDSKK